MKKLRSIGFQDIEIYSTIIITITVLLVFTGCKSTPKRADDPNPFAAVRTIELRDSTDPVLLASTNARLVHEYIEIGLTHRGYTICRDCQSDAVATVIVSEYSTKQDSKRDWAGWGNVNYIVVAESEWTLIIERNGETIFREDIEDDEAMPIDQLAGQQVKDVIQQIPARE